MVFPPASCSASSTSSPWPHSLSPVGQGCPAPGRVSRLNPQMSFHPQICPQSKRFTPMGTVGWSPVTELHVVTSPGELCSAPQVSCQPRLSTSGLSSLCNPLRHLGSSPDPSSPCLLQFQGSGDRGGSDAKGTLCSTRATRCPQTPERAAPRGCGPGLCPPRAPRWCRSGFSGALQPEGGTPRQGSAESDPRPRCRQERALWSHAWRWQLLPCGVWECPAR